METWFLFCMITGENGPSRSLVYYTLSSRTHVLRPVTEEVIFTLHLKQQTSCAHTCSGGAGSHHGHQPLCCSGCPENLACGGSCFWPLKTCCVFLVTHLYHCDFNLSSSHLNLSKWYFSGSSFLYPVTLLAYSHMGYGSHFLQYVSVEYCLNAMFWKVTCSLHSWRVYTEQESYSRH